jgi:hypothetical protein
MKRSKRIRGLKQLLQDVVEHGSIAVERVQLERAKLPFGLLERVPPIAAPARGVHILHDAAVSTTHGMIRLVNRVVGDTIDAVIDEVERAERAEGSEPTSGPGGSRGS